MNSAVPKLRAKARTAARPLSRRPAGYGFTPEQGAAARSPAPSLQPLLAAVAAGDRGAFRQLHDRTRARLHAVARRVMGDAARADEVLQEAYVAIWQHAGDYREEVASPFTWMGAIVRHRGIDARRSAVDARAVPAHVDREPALEPELRTPAPGPEARKLRASLEALPGPYRQAVVLAHVHDLSHAEVARVLGVPLGTAKSWVRRGTQALRGRVQPLATLA